MIKSRFIPDVCCSMVQRYEKYFFMHHICTIFLAKHASGSHGSFHLRQNDPLIYISAVFGKLVIKDDFFSNDIKKKTRKNPSQSWLLK